MNVSLRQLSLIDLEVIKDWYAPKSFNGRDTNKSEEYTWYIIKANETECGVIWLEKEGKTNDIAILRIMLGKALGKKQ